MPNQRLTTDNLLLLDDPVLDEEAEYSLCIDEELSLEGRPGSLTALGVLRMAPNSPHIEWVSRGLELVPKRLKAFGAHVVAG